MTKWLPLAEDRSVLTLIVGEDVDKRELSYTVGGNVNWCSHCWKQCGGFSENGKYKNTIWPSNSTLGYLFKKQTNKHQKTHSKRYMHPNVHSSTIYNSQDMETTWVSISRWMDQEAVVYIDNGILLSHKKEWNFVICTDGLGGHCAKWNKSGRERQILYDITYMWNLRKKTN